MHALTPAMSTGATPTLPVAAPPVPAAAQPDDRVAALPMTRTAAVSAVSGPSAPASVASVSAVSVSAVSVSAVSGARVAVPAPEPEPVDMSAADAGRGDRPCGPDDELDDADLDDEDSGVARRGPSHLQAASSAFDAMTSEPRLASLDCDAVTATAGADLGLPTGNVNLAVLRDWLLRNESNYPAKDAVWQTVIGNARTQRGAAVTGDGAVGGTFDWRVAALGLAMPALVRIAEQVAAGYSGDRHDLDAELVVGFLAALARAADPGKPAPYASLLMSAFRAAHEQRLGEAAVVSVADIDTVASGPRAPRRPYGHPDLLVHRAALLGVIAEQDVEPFIEIRIAGRAIEPVAERLQVTVDCLRMRMVRAAERLGEALAAGKLTDSPVPEAARRLAAAGRTNRRRTQPGPAGAGRDAALARRPAGAQVVTLADRRTPVRRVATPAAGAAEAA